MVPGAAVDFGKTKSFCSQSGEAVGILKAQHGVECDSVVEWC